MYCRRLISKCTPHLSRALPGSKVFLRFCFPLGGIHFALGGVLFSPVAWPFRWALYGLLGSVARGPKFFLQNIKSVEKIFEFKIDLLLLNFTIGCTFWLIWQNTFQISWQHWLHCSKSIFDVRTITCLNGFFKARKPRTITRLYG
jgi:hypothetical protein